MSNSKISYKTKQRDELLEYVKGTKGSHFTVEDVTNHFRSRGISIGTATIYRAIEKMLSEHIVSKYIIDEHSAACFEYTAKEEEQHNENHFHLKCENCGKLIHLVCSELNSIGDHILKEHGFSIDSFRTVFYGTCQECKNENQ